MSGTHAEMKAKCLARCSASLSHGNGYKYYMLHHGTACFCAKQHPTSVPTGKDHSKCTDQNAVWPIPADANKKCVCTNRVGAAGVAWGSRGCVPR